MEILIYDLKQRFPKDSVNVEERVVADLWLFTQLGKYSEYMQIFWISVSPVTIHKPSLCQISLQKIETLQWAI